MCNSQETEVNFSVGQETEESYHNSKRTKEACFFINILVFKSKLVPEKFSITFL